MLKLPLVAQSRSGLRSPTPRPEAGAADQSAFRVSRLVVPANSAVLELDGVRLEVPGGAVDRPTEVSITRLAVIAQLDEGMSNVTLGSTGWRFLPHGIRFRKPVRITMGFEPSIAGSPTAMSNLYTYFHDDTLGRWEQLQRESVDTKAATITSLSSHFTDMINATLKLPEGPQPIQYDVNSIKKLEAANPGEAVPVMDGPQPGPFGAASFSIPLRLPPGRGGANPQLALRYSSDAGESWLGRGFDIEVPAITIDTRFGLPRYDGTDRYSLEGEELLPVGTDRDGSLLFEPRVEKRFARIRWYRSGGAGGSDDFWQVTDKNGTINEYGHTDAGAWLGPDRSDRSRTFAWYLCRRIDSFGNTIRYSYFNDQSVSGSRPGPNNYTYLSDMLYTGSEKTGEQGPFHVQFVLESAERQDRRLDARGEFASKLARRLDHIDVTYRSTLVRRYQLSYVYNEFGQSVLNACTESDGPGATQFYRYSFEYNALPQRIDQTGTLLGYDAFGPEELWPLQASGSQFKGLNTSNTTSLGADLYVGIQISFWIPFVGTVVAASFGVRGGLSASSGATVGTLVDVNGDGLPDMVWKNGGSLNAYLNTGSGFNTWGVYSLPGLGGLLDAEQGNQFSFGVSAGLLGASGSLTWQESWSQARTGFMDVNGDGLVDYVSAGGVAFGLNTWTGLVSTPWSAVPGGAVGTFSEDTYAKSYYVQEPFRAWKAYRSGTIVVDQQATLLQPSSSSAVSLLTDPPGGRPAPSPLLLSSSTTSASALGQQFTMNAGDRLYFHEDPGSPVTSAEEASRRVSWNVKIRYSSIKLFERLQDGAVFEPPQTLSGALDPRLAPIYTGTGSSGPWTLRSNWESLDPGALAGVYAGLIDLGYFVPRRAPADLFLAVLSASAAGVPIMLRNELSNGAFSVNPRLAILEGFIYEPETGTFIRKPAAAVVPSVDPAFNSSDKVFMQYVNVLSLVQKQSIALTRTIDGSAYTPVKTFADGSVGYDAVAPRLTLPAVVTESGEQGNMLPARGLLLETTYDPSGSPLEKLWLRQDAADQWTVLARESLAPDTQGQIQEEPGAAATALSPSSISVSLNDHAISRTFTFTGKSLVQQLPDSLYSGVVSAHVLSGQSFSGQSVETIPAASWAALTNGSDTSNAVYQALLPCYAQGADGDWHLADPSTFTTDQLDAALIALQTAAPRAAGGIFTVLPADPGSGYRIVLLTQTQIDALVANMPPDGQAALAADFTQFTTTDADKTTTSWYYQTPGLGASDRDLVMSAMQRFRRDVELFPYYTFDPGANVWNVRPTVATSPSATAAVTAVLDACGIQTWTIEDRSIRYTSAEALPVIAQVSLPAGAWEDPIVPTVPRPLRPGKQSGSCGCPRSTRRAALL